MNIAIIVIYISTFAWIIPIFRQYRSNLFYFFLFLGLSDPINILLNSTTGLKPNLFFVIVTPFLFYFINMDRQKPFTINWIEIFVFILPFLLIPIIKNFKIICLIIYTFILIRMIFKILIELHHNQIINVFHLVLALYLVTAVASIIIFLNGDYQGMVLFYINLSFQILFAIFFSIFREDYPKLTYIISPTIKK